MIIIRVCTVSLLLLILDSTFSQIPGPENVRKTTESFFQKYFNLYTSSPYIHIPQPQGVVGDWVKMHLPNITRIGKKCPRNGFYSTFNPDHMSAVEELVSLYQDKDDIAGILEFSQFLKTSPDIHPHVWYASFVRAQTTLWPSYLNLDRPNPVHLFPSTFFPDTILQQFGQRYKRQAFPFSPPQFFGQQPFNQQPIAQQPFGQQPFNQQPFGQQPINQQPQCLTLDERFGEDNGAENRLWYFREDVQLNAHHWTWHLLYPTSTVQPIPRRGEFFFFYHHDLLARYTAERIANGFDPPGPIPFEIQVNSVVEEGYNPHMVDGISTMPWAPRPPFQQLSTNTLPQAVFQQLVAATRNRDRILEAVSTGTVIRGQQRVPIHTVDAINTLGELTEASAQSINPQVYGLSGLHNDGHWILSNLIGNFPAGTRGVMAHSATAIRDLLFFRWHKYVDSLFASYKTTHLAPYPLSGGENALILPGVRVTGVNMLPEDEGTANSLHTFWKNRNFILEGGLDYNLENSRQSPNVNVCAKHLDHEEFSYQIQIENSQQRSTAVMVRIFMAPRFKSLNGQQRYTFEEQRSLFFTMDAFVENLRPGNNVVNRRSIDSTLTAPWPRSIQELRRDIESGVREKNHCECGYPHHLLLPKGTEQGMTFDLFVMVTDAAGGEWQVSPSATASGSQPSQNDQSRTCAPSYIHCGINGRPYPDAKPMGYPFDRRPYVVSARVPDGRGNTVIQNLIPTTLEEYVSNVPNMAVTQVVITHQNVLRGE